MRHQPVERQQVDGGLQVRVRVKVRARARVRVRVRVRVRLSTEAASCVPTRAWASYVAT